MNDPKIHQSEKPKPVPEHVKDTESPAPVDKRFVFPGLKDEQLERSTAIGAKASELAKLFVVHTTGSTEQKRALDTLEEAVLWANIDIVRNG